MKIGRCWSPRYFAAACGLAMTLNTPAWAQNDALQEGDRVMATLGGKPWEPTPFIKRCPAGQQVAGFSLGVGDRSRWGDGIYRISPICFTAMAPAVAGASAIHEGEPYSRRVSSHASRQVSVVCPGERPVVTKMKIEIEHEIGGTGFNWGQDPWSVNGIGLYCGLVDRPQDRHVEGPAYWGILSVEQVGSLEAPRVEERVGQAALSREGTDWGNSRCADGLVAVGISGQAYERVYALGLICGYPVIAPGKEPVVKAQRRVQLPPGSEPGPLSRMSICEKAQWARARNSPAAPGLEAQCEAAGEAVQPAQDEPIQPAQTAKVILGVDVFDAPGGAGNRTGALNADTIVGLVACQADNWCHVNGNNVPNGDGWVYSGPDYRSLEV